MKKERIEFTILRYLGRPPSLFDDTAIEAVANILETASDKFNWKQFTEYATFHKLSQTLYPNMKKFNEDLTAKTRKEEDINTCGAREEEELATKGHKVHKEEINTCGAKEKQRMAKRIPENVINHFRGIFFANAARNEFLAQELVKVNKLMADNGIEMLNWKGPTLAIQAYGDLSLRQFKDLDTLVKYEDLEKAKAVLLDNGFGDITKKHILEHSAGESYEFIHRFQKYSLELECSMSLARSKFDYDYLETFNNYQLLNFSGHKIRTLSEIENLLFLSFHGTKHLWFRLRWLMDIVALYENRHVEILKSIDSFEQKDLCILNIYIAYTELNLNKSPLFQQFCKEFDINTNQKIKKAKKIIHNAILKNRNANTLKDQYNKALINYNFVEGNKNKTNYLQDVKSCNFYKRLKSKFLPNQVDYESLNISKKHYLFFMGLKIIRVAKRNIKR